VHNNAKSNRRLVSRREEYAFDAAVAAAFIAGCQPSVHASRSAENPEIRVIAIARAFSRAFPANSIRATCFRQLVTLAAAILFVLVLRASYGLDLSLGFF
jgi:hypothetical protein